MRIAPQASFDFVTSMRGNAVFSSDGTHRYLLSRLWDQKLPTVIFGMLNPSKAGETESDNTVSSCIRWARDWGYGGLWVVNAYSYIATDPRDMAKTKDPTGGDANLAAWAWALQDAEEVVLAWGAGVVPDLANTLMTLVRGSGNTPKALAVTKDGHPHHPRGLRADLRPTIYGEA